MNAESGGALSPDDLSREFEAIYRRHRQEVWAAAYSRWLDPDLALDVMQETFLRFWKQRELGETISNPLAWLTRVARNLAEDYAKSAFRRHGTQADTTLSELRSKSVGPLDVLEQTELFAHVRQMLAELRPADRELLTLRYALDYTPVQIAESLGVSVDTIHMRLSRARQRLAERLSTLGAKFPP